MATVYVVTAGSGDTYRVERVAMRQWWTGDALPDAKVVPRTRRVIDSLTLEARMLTAEVSQSHQPNVFETCG